MSLVGAGCAVLPRGITRGNILGNYVFMNTGTSNGSAIVLKIGLLLSFLFSREGLGSNVFLYVFKSSPYCSVSCRFLVGGGGVTCSFRISAEGSVVSRGLFVSGGLVLREVKLSTGSCVTRPNNVGCSRASMNGSALFLEALCFGAGFTSGSILGT